MNANEIVRVLRNRKAYKTKSDLQTTMLMAADLTTMLMAADLIESLQAEVDAERAKYAELQRYNVDCTKACDRQMVEILELREQSAQLAASQRRAQDARNELCLKCGRYHEAHKGACNGCRWKEAQKP